MEISRRRLVHGLGVGILGTGGLTACGRGGGRSRGRRRKKPTTAPTGDALVEPDTPLILGSIGASYGRSAPFETAINIALREALIDVNSEWEGLFGQKVQMTDRHVLTEAGEDLTDVIASMADAGVSAVITSIDEEPLIAAIPAFVEAGIAIIDLFTSGMSVRAPEVASSGMLVRLAPNDVAIATLYAEASWSGSSDKGGSPGTVAYVSEDTAQGRSLHHELTQILNPASGKIVVEHFYAAGEIEDVGAVVTKTLETPPALLVVNGGVEVGPYLSELRTATLDDEQRPTVEFPKRLAPGATVNYLDAELAPESLTGATGYEPGGELTVEHENMMLNANPDLLRTGYAYSQQGYDSVMLACLAAQDALSVAGTDIASAIPRVLTGTEDCKEYGACRTILRDALVAGERATVAYSGRMGPVELGSHADPRTGSIRSFTWSATNELEAGNVDSFEIEA